MSRSSRRESPQVQELREDESSGTRKYEAACEKMKQNVQNYLATHQSHLAQDEDSEEDDEQQMIILGKVVANYSSRDHNEELQQRLQDACRTGGLICLVCIENINRNAHIWSCEHCRCCFHLGCIQQWAKNSVFKKVQEQDEAAAWNNPLTREQKITIAWCCPNCRVDYSQREIPRDYTCFCSKKVNPATDPWLIPHSCGEPCDRSLESQCGHKCTLLCHPGKCPPCPLMISSPCYCGSKTKVKRCSSKYWSCQQPCGRKLTCGQHRCTRVCHEGLCGACPKLSLQKCFCDAQVKERLCAEPQWRCDQTCGKSFSCGHHQCEVVCHEGDCGECPLSGWRKCPCGKSKDTLPCTESIAPCGDTCEKPLACGVHFCMERCHKGACPSCLQYKTKTCRCGSREKTMACSKTFTCELKCKQLRDCRKHQCNRKCCPGDCLACEQPCHRMLACKNHRCESRCHPGLCFPCRLTHEVKCACGRTAIVVPCGREKSAPKPKCSFNCRKKSKCHHREQKKHKCHEGDCPPCLRTCNEAMKCSHACAAPCHDVVPVQIVDSQKRAGPWERQTTPVVQLRKLDHPKCQVGVLVSCFGEHEPVERECWRAKPYSCGLKCGRTLRCTNHVCEMDCHRVEAPPKDKTKAGKNCQMCSRSCTKARPNGCTHVCRRECHSGQCAPCEQPIRMTCHCSLLQKYATCVDWSTKNADQKEAFLSCTNYCNRTLACGHQCQRVCHSGSCTPVQQCQKKVVMKCPCRRLRKEVLCGQSQNEHSSPVCNEACHQMAQRTKKEESTKRNCAEKRSTDELTLQKRKQSAKEPSKKKKQKVWWKSQFVVTSFSIFLVIVAFLFSR